MAEQLLNAAQVGAAVEQVRCEAVTQRVRRDRAAARSPDRPLRGQAGPVRSRRRTSLVPSRRPVFERNSASVDAAALAARRAEVVARAIEVRAQRQKRRLADRHEARLATLALDPQLLAVLVDVGRAQRDELLGAQPAGVCQLEHRAVA